MSRGHGIVLLGAEVAWFGCYECGMTLKSQTATRRWNPSQKCWTLAASELLNAWLILKKHHPEAQIVDEDGVVQPEPQPRKTQRAWWEQERDRQRARTGVPVRAKQERSWAELMFSAIPEELHSDVFKALLHVLHPDKGGDDTAVRILIEARERKRGAA